MAWIRTVSDGEATGLLKKEYDEAIKRAGKVYNIVRMFSLNPRALRDTLTLYRTVMFGKSDLSRAEREMIATVVSKENSCHY